MLTDVEIEDLGHQHIGTCFNNEFAFAQAIIAATVAKLAAGVSVEPVIRASNLVTSQGVFGDLYNYENLQTAIAAARVRAINECAEAAESLNLYGSMDARVLQNATMKDCAYAIRELIGKEET